MNILSRLLLLASLALVACQDSKPAQQATPFRPGNFDANADRPAGKTPHTGPGSIASSDSRLGVPTFVWATRDGTEKSVAGANIATAARTHIVNYASHYGITAAGMNAATLHNVHDLGTGPIIATFTQNVGGVDVFRHQLSVLMDRQNNLVALSGNLSPHVENADATGSRLSFDVGATDALAFAYNDLTAELLPRTAFAEQTSTDAAYRQFLLDPSTSAVNTLTGARVKQVFYSQTTGLEPAYYIELSVGIDTDSLDYAYVVSAKNTTLLFRKNQSSDAGFSYTVWADADGRPLDAPTGREAPFPAGADANSFAQPFQDPRTLSIANYPFSKNDPWLPDSATNTFGNNVEAYADLKAPDGFSPGDVISSAVAPGSFARTYDVTQSPQASTDQIMAASTSQFYVVNFLHDWYYDAGFDEAAGNAQLSNYGRGGSEGDPIHAEAQDYSGLDNANMSTPADGKSPRMQMYVFSGMSPLHSNLLAPPAIAQNDVASQFAAFGPKTFDYTGEVVLADDGVGTSSDGCEAPFKNAAAIAGHTALLHRGACAFSVKANNAQAAGATALIVSDNRAEPPFSMAGDSTTAGITMPSVMLTQASGAAIEGQLAAGQTVKVGLKHVAAVDRDGTIDNTIIAHEWGHYISNRLIGNGSGLLGNQQGGLGEGWADFHALLFTARAQDAAIAGNETFEGIYPLAGYVMSGIEEPNFYFGIRRVPYSVDFSKDPLTFTDIQHGVALPTNAPLAFGQNGSSNEEVHSTGEVWATMLWECYVSLLQQTVGSSPRMTFDQARELMKRYIVAAYKMTPVNPTLLEARDAVLAAAFANDPVDYVLFSAAFARRGAGLRAQGPDASSNDNVGVVESFATGNDVELVSSSIAETQSACPDGVLDNGDTATITVKVRNVGTGLLSATHATVTSNNPGITFPNGNLVYFSSMEPFATATATIDVALSGATDITQIDFTIAVTDPTLAISGDVVGTLSIRANYDDVPNQSATDDAESSHVAWTLAHDTSLATLDWQRLELDATHHVLFAQDAGLTSDTYLVSPVLKVSSSAPFGFTFQQAYDFETDPSSKPPTYFDGGVIEITTDGFDWTDIGAAASYPVTLASEPSADPLQGRAAFGGQTDNFPTLVPAQTVNLGNAYAGQNVRIRFRLGTDPSGAATGWLLDNIAFNGITNTPFSVLVPDRGCTP